MPEQKFLTDLIELITSRDSLISDCVFEQFGKKIYMTNKRGQIMEEVCWDRFPLIESYGFCRVNLTSNEEGGPSYKYYGLNGVPLEFLTGNKPMLDNMWVVQEFDGFMFLSRIVYTPDTVSQLDMSFEKQIEGYGYLGYNQVIIKERNSWLQYDFYEDYVLDMKFDGASLIKNMSVQQMVDSGYYPQLIRDVCEARGEQPHFTMTDILRVKKHKAEGYIKVLETIANSHNSIEMLSVQLHLPMDLIFIIKVLLGNKKLKKF